MHDVRRPCRVAFAAFVAVILSLVASRPALAGTPLKRPAITPGTPLLQQTDIAGFVGSSLPAVNDSSAPTPLDFPVDWFGNSIGVAVVNENGILTFFSSFGDGSLPSFVPGPLSDLGQPVIAPFFADADTATGNTVWYGTGTLSSHKVFVATWPGVSCFTEDGINSVTDSFQVIITDRPDLGTTDNGDSFTVEFRYQSIQWDAGQDFSGDANCQATLGPESAVAGYSVGDGVADHSFEIPGSSMVDGFVDSNPVTGLINNSIGGSGPGDYLFTFIAGGFMPATLSTSVTQGTVTVFDTATLTVAGPVPDDGSVLYTLHNDSACGGSILSPETLVSVASGVVPNSVSYGPLAAGTYSFAATYFGGSLYELSTAACEPFTIAPVQPVLTSTIFDGSTGQPWTHPGTTGATAFETTTVGSGAAGTPSGILTYHVYESDDCSGSLFETTMANVGSSSFPTSPLGPGFYSFQVSYSGDANNLPAIDACQSIQVIPGLPTVTTVVEDDQTSSSWTNTEVTGASAHDSAVVNGAPTIPPGGTVVYDLYTGTGCTGALLQVSTEPVGAGSFSTGPLADGSYSFQATYEGDANYAIGIGACEDFSVGAAPGSIGAVVDDAATGHAWAGTEVTGAGAFDVATIAAIDAFIPTGSVTYDFFTNDACTGAPAGSDTVTLSGGVVPPSSTHGALTVGSYSFQAAYSGDSNYQPSAGACQPFTVVMATTSVSAIVDDVTTGGAWTNSEVTGAAASDTATVTGVIGIPATGTVTFSLFMNAGCTGEAASAVPGTVIANVASSGATGPLADGSYAFRAAYVGDANYFGSTGPCEAFSVGKASTTTTTAVFDAATNAAWSGTEVTGAQALDTSAVTGAPGITPTGTVAYALFNNASCSGPAVSTQNVTLNAGSVPSSASSAALTDGTYSYQATYSGDASYFGSTSLCASFSVTRAGQPITTSVRDAATIGAWSGAERPGASAFDVAVVNPNGPILPTGTITYSFFTNGTCTGTPSTMQGVLIGEAFASPATAPLVSGSYSFLAAYSGDANYSAVTAACEPFTVAPNPIVVTPSSATLAPLGRLAFTVSGGTGTGYTWSIPTNASGGTVVAGAYQAGPAAGVDVVQVADSLGETQTVNVTVTAALSLAPPAPTSPPRGSVMFAASGGAPPYAWRLQSNGSSATVSPTGVYVAGSIGSTSDTVVVTDVNGASAQAVVTVSAGITIGQPAAGVDPGGAIAFTATGGSGQGYAWSLSANRSGGTINASTGAYTAGTKGSVSDVVTVVDSLGNTASASISVGGGIAIAPFDPSVPPSGTQTFTATGGSGTGYTWTLTASPSGGTVGASTGVYVAGTTGSRTDVLQVVDSLGNTATTNITVTAGVNISPATPSVAPLGTVSFGAGGGSGTGYTYALTTNASGGSINATTGAYKAGSTGSVTDTVAVTDSLGDTASTVVSVTAALAVTPTAPHVAPRGSTTFQASGGSGTYAFSLQTNASGGSITAQGVYTAGATPGVVDVVAALDTNGAAVTVNVTVGAGITISPATPSVAPGGNVPFTATGGSGTGYTWTLTTNQSGGSITAAGAYTAGTTGKTADTVKVTDSLGNSATTSISVGGGLVISPVTASTSPLGKVSFSAVGGAGGYQFAITTNASGGSIDASSGAYTAGSKGSVTDIVSVTDAGGNTATAHVSVGATVAITPTTATVTPGAAVPFSVAGGSGTGYAWSITTNASGGTINAATGVYTAGAAAGTDTVTVTDSLGNAATATVTVKTAPMTSDGGVDGGMTDAGMTDAGTTDAGTTDAGMAADASTKDAGAKSDGGDAGSSGSSGGGSGGGGSCGCTLVGTESSGFGGLGALVMGLALAVRRRRRA